MEIWTALLLSLTALVTGVLIGLRWAARPGRHDAVAAELVSRADDQAVIRDGLDRLHDRLRDVETTRATWQGQLHQQVDEVRHSTDLLRRETGALSTALRRPHVRGQWGELHLRRTVELAGMVAHCDFEEQQQVTSQGGVQRPDLVVHLAGGRCVVVDAKVPLDAHLDALATDDLAEREDCLRRHARQLRRHVDALASKAYWRALEGTPEFVVLFLPAESFLAAALEADDDLVEYAAARNVVLATPTTLITLLKTVAHGWTTQALAERTREIHELGRDLHARLGVMGGHLDKVGRSLKASVEAYNSAVGSLESRVLVTARQFEDIGVSSSTLDPVSSVTRTPRPLTAPELLESVAPVREEIIEVDATGSSDGESTRASA